MSPTLLNNLQVDLYDFTNLCVIMVSDAGRLRTMNEGKMGRARWVMTSGIDFIVDAGHRGKGSRLCQTRS